MKVIYVGQFTEGTTSKMRAETIQSILRPEIFHVIDTNIPFHKTSRLSRTLGFRFKKGPLIKNCNAFIMQELMPLVNKIKFNLIWVDKGVYVNENTTKYLREQTLKLVHFTPDPAFTFHQSKLFIKSLPLYDFAITTKSYELKNFYNYLPQNKVIYCTQGFDEKLHKPYESSKLKEGLLFIGHHEIEREKVLNILLELNINIVLAGIKWEGFVEKHKKNKYLRYLGSGIYGEEYARQISFSKIAWGALSKWIPEQHTTRTFEIPACGTVLLTEYNEEVASFFKDDEVVFYSSTEELVNKVLYFLNNDVELKQLAKKGYDRVHADGYSYTAILRSVLKKVL
jgi:spore maturation protein CgeB